MTRILVDVPDSQLSDLMLIADADKRSRAAVIRDALDGYIAQRKPVLGVDIFGLWKDKDIDGLDYQDTLRSEW
ncbi:CopG family transcriptional regulator [Caballeronia sp. 15715]|uniref:CopG family transcriptional regulator n=1 Tax=unclassified Caballeronia TaxID=2646786 RepID=UPI0039E57E43